MIVWKKRFLAQITVLLLILLLLSPVTTSFAQEDITPPTLNSLTVSVKEATVGDKIKISADVTDDLSGVRQVSLYYSNLDGSGSKYVALKKYTSTNGKYQGTFSVGQYDAEGKYEITSISVTDKQSNKYTYYNKPYTTKSTYYEYRDLSNYDINVYGTTPDVTPPTLNSLTVSAKEVAFGDKVKISADVTDDLSGVKYVRLYYSNPKNKPGDKLVSLNYNSTTGKYEGIFGQYKTKDKLKGEYYITDINAEGVWRIEKIYLADNLGHLSVINNENRDLSNYNITIGLPPVTKIELQSSLPKVNEWYSSDVNVSLNATDDQSGVAKTLYKINNGDWNQYTKAFKLQNEGIHTIEYKSIDKAGNEEVVKSEAVKIDKTAPVSAASDVPTNKTNKDVPITLSASDKHSGVAKTEYRMNDGEWTKYTEPINSFVKGKNLVDYRSIDHAGNVEVFKSFEVNIDKSTPVTTPEEDDEQDKDLDDKESGADKESEKDKEPGTDKDSEIEREKTENDQNSFDGNKQVDSDKHTQQPVNVMEKNELPATATTVYNFFLLGFVILGFGGAILYIGKKKRANH